MKTFYNTVYAEQLKRIRKECRMTQVELSTH